MPKRTLYLKCYLHGIERLYIEDPPSYEWKVKLKCRRCGDVSKNWISIVSKIFYEKERGGLPVNYYHKVCKYCRYEGGTINIYLQSVKDYCKSKNQWQPIVSFECRGVEPVEFIPTIGWSAISVKGTEFCIDLSKEMWIGFDPFTDDDNEELRIKFIAAKFAITTDKL